MNHPERRVKGRRRRERGPVWAAAVCVLAAVWASGCRSLDVATYEWAPTPAPESPTRVWPPAPAAPRIRYVGSVAADLGVRPSRGARIVNAIVGAGKPAERLIRPMGIALDEADNVCLTDPEAGAVCFFDVAQRRLTRWTRIGNVEFISPVAVAKRAETLFVADTQRNEVIAFTRSGTLLFSITNMLRRPAGLAIAGDRLFVADAQLHCLLVFDLQGRLLDEVGERGEGPGQFNFPTHVSTDARGNIYVTDSMNNRIQVFDPRLVYRCQMGGEGGGSGHFNRPKGVAADSFGHVYAADALFDNIQVFDQTGRFLMDWGTAGSGPGEFWMPAGLAISRGNRIFVVDSYNRRVQMFQYIGEP